MKDRFDCPICQMHLLIFGSMVMGGIAATCSNMKCQASEIVEVADKESDAIAAFQKKASKEVGK